MLNKAVSGHHHYTPLSIAITELLIHFLFAGWRTNG